MNIDPVAQMPVTLSTPTGPDSYDGAAAATTITSTRAYVEPANADRTVWPIAADKVDFFVYLKPGDTVTGRTVVTWNGKQLRGVAAPREYWRPDINQHVYSVLACVSVGRG